MMTAVNVAPPVLPDISEPALWLDCYGDFLYRYALSRLHDEFAAEDSVQETLLAAMKSRKRFAKFSSERTWLVGIMKHKIIDRFRLIFRETNVSALLEAEESDEEFFERNGQWHENFRPNEWSGNPEELLEQKELQESLRSSLACIPTRLACVFTLHEIEGLDNDEICRLLNISQENLWVMLHRARLHLRQNLESRRFVN